MSAQPFEEHPDRTLFWPLALLLLTASVLRLTPTVAVKFAAVVGVDVNCHDDKALVQQALQRRNARDEQRRPGAQVRCNHPRVLAW